jgi:ribosomal protein S18 acetylase RimI-like enzyme
MAKSNETLTVALPVSVDVNAISGSRAMTRADIDSLVDLWLASYPPAVIDGASREDVEADWTAAFDGDYGHLLTEASLVIEEDGRIVAAVQTVLDAVWDRTPRGPFIIELIVHPTARRRGFAAALMSEVLDCLGGAGFSSVGLRVESDNLVAKHLYESFGFRSERRAHSPRSSGRARS